jgi:hypothetical protein
MTSDPYAVLVELALGELGALQDSGRAARAYASIA